MLAPTTRAMSCPTLGFSVMIAIILGKNLAVPRHSQGGRERRFDIGLYKILSCRLDAGNLKERLAVVLAHKLQCGIKDDIHAQQHET